MQRAVGIGFLGILSFAIASCSGGDGPSADEAKSAIDRQIQAMLPNPGFEIPFTVSDISCKPNSAATYRCEVTKTTTAAGRSVTVTSPYSFAKQEGQWTATPLP